MLCDIGPTLDSPLSHAALAQSDEVWLLTTADPIQINLHMEKSIEILRKYAPNSKIGLIGNKWRSDLSEYVTPKTIQQKTGLEMITTIPEMSHITIPSAWTGERAIKQKEGNALLEEPFQLLSRRILPEQFVRNKKSKKRWKWF